MKITVEATAEASIGPLGAGRVYVGKTSKGTPIRVLVSGLLPGSDDPKMIERFDREQATLPKIEVPLCPGCGQPMEAHTGVVTKAVHVDIYAIIARIVTGARVTADDGDPRDVDQLAEVFRQKLEARDKEQHDRLYNAAVCVLEYIEAQFNAQAIPMDEQVAGHA